MGDGKALRAFMVICGSLEIVLFGGIIFGWASLVYIYKDEGYFSHLCTNHTFGGNISATLPQTNEYSTSTLDPSVRASLSSNLTNGGGRNLDSNHGALSCKEQDNQFNLVFSISTVFTGIMCFVNGLIYDKLGTRFCRILAILCFIGAMLCLIFASPEVPMLLYPGTILLVYGGYLLLITNLQLANLMPHLRSTIMSLYAGSYDCSAVIFLIFKAAHEAGVRVNTCFIIQGCAFTILVSISTFCTLPKYHLPWPLPPGFRVKTPVSSICRKKSQVKKNNEAGPTEAGNEDNAEDPTKNVDANRNRSSPKKSPLMLNVDQRSTSSKQTRPKSISQYLDVTHMKEGDISSQEFLLAINHVPRLSTASIHRSHLRRSAHKSSAVSLLRRTQKYSVNQHHMSMLNIPNQTQRSMLHRPSVSLDNVNRSPRMTTPGEDLLAINHVPRLSAATLSVHQSSPAISVFHSLASVSGVSNIMKPIEADDLQDADMGDSSVYEKRTTFRKEALSPLFMMEVMWMSFQRLRSWFFVGVFNPWITNMANGDRKTVSFYTSVFAAMQFFGIFTAPLNGRLMDRKPGKKYNYNNTKFERLHAAIPSFVLNCTVVLLLSIGAAIPVLEVQYVTFALHVLNRSFIYGPNSAFVANAFPFEYFGILLGTTLTVSAIFGMIQYPLFLLIQGPLEDDPTIVNITLIVLMTVTYAHPLYIWIYLKKKLKKQIHPNESAEPIKLNTDDCDENMDNRNVEVNNELNSLRNEVNNDMNNEVNNGLSANQEAVFPNANLADGYGSESETVEGATTPSYQESDEKTYL